MHKESGFSGIMAQSSLTRVDKIHLSANTTSNPTCVNGGDINFIAGLRSAFSLLKECGWRSIGANSRLWITVSHISTRDSS